ncbi:helix-turn-helix transcriptional regulator [Saccharothrix sp. Mg75]|uniref:helix-turn-helix transcriptional regulator n=1 Tax=Saccharothrix sp. Mg75 TaxID=3445357 RepID=UPI003EEBA2F9
MTAVDLLCVCLRTPDPTSRDRLLATLRQAGIAIAPTPEHASAPVVLAAARTVDEALDASGRPTTRRVLVIAETFSPAEAARAVRAGADALLRSAHATPTRLLNTLHSLHDGDGRLPHDLLVRVVGRGMLTKPRHLPALTDRQVVVLHLMADGLDNATIAHSLSCSAHTVKNVIYELMTRLNARNRAHAVAAAVRSGLI